jgi:hypothetical protein
MTKLQMQAAGDEDTAIRDGTNAASLLCTGTSINENLVRTPGIVSSLDK